MIDTARAQGRSDDSRAGTSGNREAESKCALEEKTKRTKETRLTNDAQRRAGVRGQPRRRERGSYESNRATRSAARPTTTTTTTTGMTAEEGENRGPQSRRHLSSSSSTRLLECAPRVRAWVLGSWDLAGEDAAAGHPMRGAFSWVLRGRFMQQHTVSSAWRPSCSSGAFSSSSWRTLLRPETHSSAMACVSARMRYPGWLLSAEMGTMQNSPETPLSTSLISLVFLRSSMLITRAWALSAGHAWYE
mmetsp:Transcript_16986/g.68502  ORF Transcript_16986/g.68502 Transcript_16986/m.68502 type:complete len:247 (-) Transcript_16986:205-945(-)